MADRFPTTRWSMVAAAADVARSDARAALSTMCETYWHPLYAFLRHHGHGPDQAQDLVQGFFALMLEKNHLRDFRREKGRFRTFLLACLRHYVANEMDRAGALKRGGGVDVEPLDAPPAGGLTPEEVFEKQWAIALLSAAMKRLEKEQAAEGKSSAFDVLKQFLTADDNAVPYRDVARRLGMSEGAVRTAAHRLRRRFHEVVREEIADTVADPAEVGDEVRYMIGVLGRKNRAL